MNTRRCVPTSWGPIHCLESGEGPPLILLHSSSGTSAVFRKLMEHLPKLRCIAPDLPGFGESPPLPAGAQMDDIARFLVEFIEALGLERAHLLGLHSGNKIAAACAALAAHRIDRLMLVGMTHSLIVDQAQRNVAMLRYAGRELPNARPARTDTVTSAGADAMYAANLGFDLSAALRRIQAPTMIVELRTPAEDALPPQAPLLASNMANARSTWLSGNDRDLLQQRPVELAEIAKEFFRREPVA